MLGNMARILTTHAGSLPRSPALTQLLIRQSRGEAVAPELLAREVEASTRHVLGAQLAAGIDVGNNGEQPRESFITYVRHRLSGFGGESNRPPMRDLVEYSTFLALKAPFFSRPMVSLLAAPQAIGPIRYLGTGAIDAECAEFARLLVDQPARFSETFLTAPSPGIVASAMLNAHYPSLEEYVGALAEALQPEYEAVVRAGHILQLDCPDLAMERHTSFADRPLGDFLRFVDTAILALNRALDRLPPERVRLHVCWGNYEGPHDLDAPLNEVLPRLYTARVGALVISLANPRHAHEYRCFARHPLPAGMLLVAGVIDTTTNYVEHPEVVADRLERAAIAVGDPRRVLAGTDCGFDTAAGLGEVAEEVVWQKLRALRAGADLATKRLFSA